MLKHLSLLILFLVPYVSMSQQTGIISGSVLSGGRSIPFANVGIMGTTFGAVTDLNGKFEIKIVAYGEYTVKVTYVGYESRQLQVTLTEQQSSAEIIFHIYPAVTSLNELVVTGTRSEKRRLDSAVPVNVIDSRTLRNTQSLTLAEGLSFTSGIRVEKDCQTCNYTQVRMNGLPGSYSQILINSRPLFSSLAGLYGLEQVPVSMIERIEIVKGGGSVLYGSNAIGGTINIITKDPKENILDVNSTISSIDGSSPDLQADLYASAIGPSKKSGGSVIISRQERQSWDANHDGFSELPQIKNLSLGLNTFYLPSNSSRIGISLNSINEIRNGGDQLMRIPHERMQSEFRDSKIAAANVDFTQSLYSLRSDFSLYAGAQQTLREHYTGSFGADGYGDTKNHTMLAGAQFSHTLLNFIKGKNKLTSGIEYQYDFVHDEIKAYNYRVHQETFQTGIYLQSDWDFTPKLNIVSGIRVSSQNTTDELILSPRINVLYKLTEKLQLRGGRSEGFRAPQAFDTDMHIAFSGGGVAVTQIDPTLRPEKSESYTFSVDFNNPANKYIYGISVSGFYTHIKNVFVLEEAGSVGENTILLRTNGSHAIVKGITAEARYNFNYRLEGDLGFTFQQSEFGEPVEWSNTIRGSRKFFRTPAMYGYLAMSYKFRNNLRPGLSCVYTGPMYIPHFAGAPGVTHDHVIRSQSFIEINLKSDYVLPVKLKYWSFSVTAGVQNIFNEFQDDFDRGPNRDSNFMYGPGRPRTFFAGLKVERNKNE